MTIIPSFILSSICLGWLSKIRLCWPLTISSQYPTEPPNSPINFREKTKLCNKTYMSSTKLVLFFPNSCEDFFPTLVFKRRNYYSLWSLSYFMHMCPCCSTIWRSWCSRISFPLPGPSRCSFFCGGVPPSARLQSSPYQLSPTHCNTPISPNRKPPRAK